MKTILGWSLVTLFSLACLGSANGCSGQKPTTFYITFKDAQNLQPGQFLAYHGMRIGEVLSVDLASTGRVSVKVKVESQFRANVYREARFQIEKPGGIVDVSGEKQLTMSDRGNTRTPIQEGDVLEGTEGWWGALFEDIGDSGTSVWNYFRNTAQSGWESMSAIFSSPEGKKFLKTAGEYAEKAKELGEEQFNAFKKGSLPELEKQANVLKEEMQKQGKAEEAQLFWKQFTTWLEEQRKK